jgi:hypothetical protein
MMVASSAILQQARIAQLVSTSSFFSFRGMIQW